jgi:hypothetical protein
MVSSACWASGPGLLEQELLAELQEGPGGEVTLACSIDLSAVQPGSGFQVWVVNDANHRSAKEPFQVRSASALLTSISPSRMNPSAPTQVKAFGSGFDITSKVWLSGAGIATQPINTYLDTPSQLTMTAPNLAAGGVCGASACPPTGPSTRYFLEVCNGCDLQRLPTGASGRRELILETSGRAVTGVVSPSPAVALQGTTPTVTLGGSNLTGTSPRLEYLPAGATAWLPAGSPASTATSVSGQVSLLDDPRGAAPTGTWGLRVRYDDSTPPTYSASFGLRVDSNQARISAVPVPATGQAGNTQQVTLTVTGLQAPLGQVRVLLYDPAAAPPTCPSTACLAPSAITQSGTSNVTVQLPLAGLDAKPYALAVLNPNFALPSVPTTFTVLPGIPTVATMGCTSVAPAPGALCETATTARQQPSKVPVRITGTNFALPDLANQNGSQVAISCAAVGVADYLLPAGDVRVVSSTELAVSLDTTLAALPWVGGAQVAADYTFQVWNRGGAQRSATYGTPFTIKP